MSVPGAYRRLYRHHKLLGDHLCRIGDAAGSVGLRFERWDPMYNARPPCSTSEFFRPDYWTWDMLVAHSLRLIWQGAGRRLIVEAVSDSGFKEFEVEPNPGYFTPLADAKAELRLGLFVSTAKKIDWEAVWKSWKAEQKGVNLHDGNDHLFEVDGQRSCYRRLVVDVGQLPDEDACRSLVIEPLLGWFSRQAV